ncbi:hypothetical protein DV738_g275, partial [Chaetothyriales sp. CBS 135597]
MQLYINIILLAFASSILGAPAAVDENVVTVDPQVVQQLVAGNTTGLDTPHLHKRTDYGFYQCSLTGFQGHCVMTMGVQDGVCRKNVVGMSASMCPDKGVLCTVYENWKCEGTGIYPFGYPGIVDFLWDIWWGAVSTRETRDPPRSFRQ